MKRRLNYGYAFVGERTKRRKEKQKKSIDCLPVIAWVVMIKTIRWKANIEEIMEGICCVQWVGHVTEKETNEPTMNLRTADGYLCEKREDVTRIIGENSFSVIIRLSKPSITLLPKGYRIRK